MGCEALAQKIQTLNLKIHVFGLIHEGYSVQKHGSEGASKNLLREMILIF
jgi:Icc-related predicted phosphoesterase